MKETYTSQDSAFVSSASHGQRDSNRAKTPVSQDTPEDDDEPPIRPPEHPNEKIRSGGTDLVVEKRPFDRDPAELAQYLHTSLSSGLDEAEAQTRLQHYGKNILKGQEKITVWLVLWRQVSNAMTVILLGALAIAFATEDYAEGGVIAGIYPC
jgi:magnesium-transporting ATPase (P-type)